jgi:hypothetical protein
MIMKSFGNSLSQDDAGSYGVPLEMVRLAPSASNKQPWRIVAGGGHFHFYLQHTRGYSKALGYDIQKVDMGIAMCHFELTAEELGLKGAWSVKDPGASNLPEGAEYIVSWEAK